MILAFSRAHRKVSTHLENRSTITKRYFHLYTDGMCVKSVHKEWKGLLGGSNASCLAVLLHTLTLAHVRQVSNIVSVILLTSAKEKNVEQI